jgi:hypothetical protein
MRYWTPEAGAPHLLDWWMPLVRAARRALDDEVPWLIVVDEWKLAGRVVRQGRPDVWVYAHGRSGGELLVDHTGQPYRFISNSAGPSPGRFKEIEIRQAVWRAGLPDVNEGVGFERPHRISDRSEHHESPAVCGEGPGGRPALRLVR